MRRLGNWCVLAGVVVGVAAVAAAAQGASSGRSRLDQTDLPRAFAASGADFGGMWGLTSLDPAAQTFVAGRTGLLTRVLLPILGCNGISAGTANPTQMTQGCQSTVPDLDVKIASLDGGIAAMKVLAEAASVTPPSAAGSTAASAVSVSFAGGARVVKGKAYALVVTPLADWPPASYEWSCFKTATYRPGRAFWHYRGAWVPVRSGPFAHNGAVEFGFATYVTSR